MLRLILLATCLLAAPAIAQDAPRLGRTSFPTSAGAAAQAHFIEGVLWLHSFEYDRAAAAFRAAQQAEPGFALAYWGEAMTYNHPVWFQQDAAAARAALNRLAPTREARRAKAPTEREKLYMDAVEILFGEGDKARRDTAYAEAMRALFEKSPDDENAAAFYALALLGTSHGGRDIPTYMRAAAVVEEVFAKNPDHPGAAHYLIHSYDDPVHAPLGLRAARAYSKIAPDAAHAQHMTTHIFVALGMWDDVVAQNEIASGPDRSRWAPGHYTIWLGYGYVQQGRYARALEHLEAVRRQMPQQPRFLTGLSIMRADYVVNTERWDSPTLAWPIELPADAWFPRALNAFVEGLSASKRGDEAGAARALVWLDELGSAGRAATAHDPNDNRAAIVEILETELAALVRLGTGNADEAVALLREAAAAEEAMPFEFGPPAVVKPGPELLGEVLLELGRPAEARHAFERSLARAPGRALSLLGLARAAAAAGDRDTAARAYVQLQANWHAADAGIPGREELERFLATAASSE